MAQDMINTRIELDRETDAIYRKIKSGEERNSKRETIAVVLRRIARIFQDNPQALRQLGIIRDS